MNRFDHWWEKASPERRIDLNLGNMFMLLALMIPSVSIILKGPVTLNNMPVSMQIAMCVCIFTGCGMKLHGALAGHRFWFPKTSVKRCYTYGYSGAPIAFVGCITYAYFILGNIDNVWSAMSSIGILFFGTGILCQGALYLLEYRRIDRNEQQLRSLKADAERAGEL